MSEGASKPNLPTAYTVKDLHDTLAGIIAAGHGEAPITLQIEGRGRANLGAVGSHNSGCTLHGREPVPELKLDRLPNVFQEMAKWQAEFDAHNRLEGHCLSLDRQGPRCQCTGTYDIDLSEIKTHRDMLDLIRQLGGKAWMETDRLMGIMRLVSKECRIQY